VIEVDLRKCLGHLEGGFHVTERGREDDLVALGGQVADHAFGIRALGHAFNDARLDLVAKFFHCLLAPEIVCEGPPAIADGADIDPGHLEWVCGARPARRKHAACQEAQCRFSDAHAFAPV
jgi:hypothetical protein